MTSCPHEGSITDVVPDAPHYCPDCVVAGAVWVHLRICLVCGHVGCCDDSPNRHARRHWEASGHPVMQSYEPREIWRWCFADEVMLPRACMPFRR